MWEVRPKMGIKGRGRIKVNHERYVIGEERKVFSVWRHRI